mgnify:FL=1
MEKLLVSSSPHLRSGASTQRIMLDVIIALCPALIASFVFFGPRALLLVAVTVLSCVLSEYVSRKIMKRSNTVPDLSCIVTGLLLAFNLPVSLNPLMAAFGGMVAIVVVKQMFGGIGQNFVNPALTARIILMNSFPADMSAWTPAFGWLNGTDATTTATPLGVLKEGGDFTFSHLDLFLGNTGGCLGETCALALILGGMYLMVRRVISPVIPVTYLATVAVISLIAGRDPLVDLLSGGLLIGAFFMATDYTTSPISRNGRIVYALGCGVFTMLIRMFASLPEGVSYSIVLMNILVPLIERFTLPKPFGSQKKARESK